jgi:ABC-type lipoprotein release transport system permease subunit
LLTEGLTLGLLGWLFGALLGVPTAWLLAQVIGRAFLLTPLPFTYAWPAAGYWLVVTLVIGAVGALRPAHTASRLTIQETLAYE